VISQLKHYHKIQTKPFANLRNNVPTKTAKVELHTISVITTLEILIAKNKQFLKVQIFHVILRSKDIREESQFTLQKISTQMV